MNRLAKVVMLTTLVLGVGFVLIGITSELRAAEPPEKVTICVIKDKKPCVDFPHKAHQERLQGKCGDCHVNAAGGGALKPEFLAKPADMAAAMKHPFHNTCTGCHKSAGKGPTSCSDCHK